MTEISDPLDIDRPPSNRWAEVWRQFRAHKGAMAGAVVFGLIIAGVFLGPFVYPHDPQYLPSGRDFITLRDTRPIYVALWDPSAKVNWHYVLGTDNLGRDNLARFLSGGRVSISVGLTAMILSIVLGTFVGLIAGFFRLFDGPLMRLTDLFLAFDLGGLCAVSREPGAVAWTRDGHVLVDRRFDWPDQLDADGPYCAG